MHPSRMAFGARLGILLLTAIGLLEVIGVIGRISPGAGVVAVRLSGVMLVAAG